MTGKFKSLAILLCTLLLAIMFISCKPDKNDNGLENAVFYDNVQLYLHDDYLNNNITRFPSIDGSDQRPEYLINIIRSQTEFTAAVQENYIDIDFDKETLILYFFTDLYMGFECRLQNIQINDRKLNINIFHAIDDAPCTSLPTQRCLAIKTTLSDFDSVNVKITYS